MEKQYKYDAFISYRHLSPDKPIAIRLQKLLETYTPPKGAVGQVDQADAESQPGASGQNGQPNPAARQNQPKPRKLHLFRDESELPTSNDLGADIQSALEQSRFLVVICSPQFEKSKWCMQEVTYFKALHGGSNRNILPLLVDDPDHSPVFPDALRYETRQVTRPDGTVEEIQNEIEPLAANVSAKSLSQMLKRLKTEYLRIAAPLFGCGFDDLYRRDQRRRNRRRAALFGGVTAILGTAAVLSTSALVTISSQKRQIEADAAELLRNNQELWMRESKMLEKDGDLYGALEAVAQAYPEEGEPLSGVFGQSVSLLGSYEPDTFTAVRKIKLSAQPSDMCVLNNGKTLAVRTVSGLSLWNTETGKLISDFGAVSDVAFSRDPQIQKASVYNFAVGSILSNNVGNVALYPMFHKTITDEIPVNGGNAMYVTSLDKTVSKLSPEDGSVLWSVQLDSYANFPVTQLQPGCLVPVNTYDHLLLLDPTDGTEKARYELDALKEMLGYTYYYKVFESNGYLIFTVSSNGSMNCIVCRTAQQMPEEIFRAELYANATLGEASYSIYGNTLCVTGYTFAGILDEAMTYFKGYSLTDGTFLWSGEMQTFLPGAPFTGIIAPDSGSQNSDPIVFGIVGDRLFVANTKTKRLYFNQQLPGTVKNVYYSENGHVFVTDESGLEYFFSLRRFDSNSSSVMLFEDREYRTAVNRVAYGNNLYAVVRGNESEISLYRVLTNEARKTLFQTGKGDEWGISEAILNADSTLAVIGQSNPYKLTVLDPESGKVLQTIRCDALPRVSFFGSDRLLIREDNTLRIVDITSGETEQEFSNEEYNLWSYVQGEDCLVIERSADHVWFKVMPGQEPAEVTISNPDDDPYLSKSVLSVSPSGQYLLLSLVDYSVEEGGLTFWILNLETGEILNCEDLPQLSRIVTDESYLWKETDQEIYIRWNNRIIGYSCTDGSLVCESEDPEAVELILVENALCVLDKAGYLVRLEKEGLTLVETQREQVTSLNPSQGWIYESGQNGNGYLYLPGTGACVVIHSESFDVLYTISHFCGLSKDRGTVYIHYYNCFDAYPVPDVGQLRQQITERLQ
ncbi:MAG: toll/interleukin-1 receptor domain-containing protein [Firmicutes bacterium]|nr:toll/interleukin-1 receptor domain-containing protein [Bacillota bacterium]